MAAQDSQPFHWHYTELDDQNFQVHGRSLILIIILFALLIVFTLLCLYARWVCRYRELSYTTSSATATATATTTTTTATIQNNPTVGLDRDTINKIPIILHRSSGTTDEEAAAAAQCSICLTTFHDEEKVKVLTHCKHSYHPECVDRWLITHSNCPLCRASLRVLVDDSELP